MMEMGHAASTRQGEGWFGSANNFVGANLLWYTGQACDTGNETCAASIAFDKFYTTPYTSANPLSGRFMTYRMYWNESQIRLVAVDNGIEYDLYAAPFPIGPNEDAFQKPYYFLLNLAVGGTFTGLFDTNEITAPLPAKMYIDYVKVSKWNGAGTVTYAGGGLLANGGGEIIKPDLDQDGVETVTLDGSHSYGAISAYEWSVNGVILSQDAVAELTLPAGVHNLTLKVSDDFGNVSTDLVKVEIRELLWSEEFDTFDTNIWTAQTGDGCPELCGWGNQELQYYQEENVYVEPIGTRGNNALVIEAKAESAGGYGFTSGRIETKDKLTIRYGLIETRIKVPDDLSTGLWPAAWLLGANIDDVGWPRAGEVDMMEMGHNSQFRIDQEVSGYTENEIVGGNIIFYSDEACGGDPNCAASISYDKWYNKLYVTETPMTNRFLTYRMYWDPNSIRLTAVDNGVEFDLYTAPFPLGADEGAFNKPFYYLLNLAVGGQFTGAANDSQVTAQLPGKMLIDYVRVFRWNGYGEVATGDGVVANAGPDIVVLDAQQDGTEIVTLDGSGSTDHNGEIVTHSWSIGGVEIATGQIAPVALPRGVHEVLLTVEDDLGNTGTDTVLVTISNGGLAPVADAGPDQELADDDGDDLVMVTLDASLSEAAGSPIVSYTWLENGLEIATGVAPTVQFSTGIHHITLEVADEDGSIGTDEVVITVIDPDNSAPIANAGEDISVDDLDGDDQVEITLSATSSTDSDGTIESYLWLWNGMEIATGETAMVVLSTGTYEVTLRVTDDDGVTSTDNLTVTITDPDNNAPSAAAGDDQLVIDSDLDGIEEFALDASGSSDSDGTIESYVWKDGGAILGTDTVLTLELPLGEYLITLEVTDDDGVSTTDEVRIFVNQLPVAVAGPDIKVTDANSSGDETASLDGSGSSDPDGIIAAYSWIFGGVEIGSAATLDYAFPVGANEVTLMVTDNFGSQVADGVTVHVARTGNLAPTADAGTDFESIADESGFRDVVLNGSGSFDPDGSIYSYTWFKGEIEIADGLNPTVNLGIGVHSIELVVTDEEGAEGSDLVQVTINQRVNIALNKPVTTSTIENAGTPGHAAVDGDPVTRWASAFFDPQWIYVDLQRLYNLDEVVFVWEAAYASVYEVQVSSDAINWTTIVSESNGGGGTEALAVEAFGRYVRMYGTARGTEYGYSLYEFEIYGTEFASAQDASLKEILVDAGPLQGFDPNVLVYDVTLNPGTTVVPFVDATPNNDQATVQVHPAASLPGSTIIDVTSEDATVVLTYTVNFNLGDVNENLALDKPTSSSSNENIEFLSSNAVDGDPATRWSSAFGDPQWIYVDLGEIRDIGKVVLVWEAAYALAYEIQVSDDAVNWTTLFAETAGNGGTDEIDLSGSGRYVRMYGTSRATPYGYSLYEFEVYPAAAEPGPAPVVTIEAGVAIRWFAENGVLYQVQWSSELNGDEASWNDLGDPVTGDGTIQTVLDTGGPPRNFYRVIEMDSI
jgi:beta-glucanase (GH16 family)